MAAHEKETHDCIICASALGTNGGTLTLLCGHPFCAECICRWRQRSWRCPVCRIMDNRELSANAATAVSGRPGNIGQVSRRLRPMAEQLLAENGDNVLDVLLQLLEGIQDGTLPAEVETAVSDAADSNSVRASSGNPGGTSLDRLVLSQLVTVLQATSALSGAGQQSIADISHPARASQAHAQPASSNRRRRHPSERHRRAAAAMQPPIVEPANPSASMPTLAENTPATLEQSVAGPGSQPPMSVALESKSPPGPLKCDASTQTSDFSDREERRLRTSRLRRESRGAALEGTVSISPELTAGPISYDSAAGSSAPIAAEHFSTSGTQAACQNSRAGPHGSKGDKNSERVASAAQWTLAGPGSHDSSAGSQVQPAVELLRTHGTRFTRPSASAGPQEFEGDKATTPAAEAAPSIGAVRGKAVSDAASSGTSVPSAALKGKEKAAPVEKMVFMAGYEATGTEQHCRLPEESESSIMEGEPGTAGAGRQGHALGGAKLEAVGSQNSGNSLREKPADGSTDAKAELADEAPALDFSQIRRAWEERFGPSKRSKVLPLQKRSLESPGFSDSTSNCSSASFPGGGTSTLLLPSQMQLPSSMAAQSAPANLHRSASLEVPGPSEGASSPYAVPLAALGLSAPPQSPVYAPEQASRPVLFHVPVQQGTQQQATSNGGLVISPDPGPALRGQSLDSMSILQTQQAPESRIAQRSSDSSEATVPSLLEAPDTATPSASDESFGHPNQADDSTFVTSRATSLARTLTPEDFPLAEIPHSLSSESMPTEETPPPLANHDSTVATSMRLPTSLLGRRRTRSEAEEARVARQGPIVAPPNTAMQSLANSGASSPRPLGPSPAPKPQLSQGPVAQAGDGDPGGSKPLEPIMPRRASRARPNSLHSLEREQLLLRAVDDVENLVDNLLAKWNSLSAGEQPPHLGERLEELFLEASMLEAVRNNQVPKPRAMVEDILARVTLLDAELGTHMGPVPPPSPTSSMGSPLATGTGSQVPASKLLGSPAAPAGRLDPIVPDSQAGVPGQTGAPGQQQPAQQVVPEPQPFTAGQPGAPGSLQQPPQASWSGVQMPHATQGSQPEERSDELLAVPTPAQAPQPARVQEETQPVSPLPVGRMTQGTSIRPGHRSSSGRPVASERRARRSAAARMAAVPPSGHDAAEAEGALDRFTAFLEHHESELQPRTRQIAELALTLARLSLVTGASEQTARLATTAPDTHPSPMP